MPAAKERDNITSDAKEAASDIAKNAAREGKRLADFAAQRVTEAVRT